MRAPKGPECWRGNSSTPPGALTIPRTRYRPGLDGSFFSWRSAICGKRRRMMVSLGHGGSVAVLVDEEHANPTLPPLLRKYTHQPEKRLGSRMTHAKRSLQVEGVIERALALLHGRLRRPRRPAPNGRAPSHRRATMGTLQDTIAAACSASNCLRDASASMRRLSARTVRKGTVRPQHNPRNGRRPGIRPIHSASRRSDTGSCAGSSEPKPDCKASSGCELEVSAHGMDRLRSMVEVDWVTSDSVGHSDPVRSAMIP